MQQNSQKRGYEEVEIDLLKVTNQLVASKKLIITITLLFTILASIVAISRPPTFISTALVEIGQYDSNKLRPINHSLHLMEIDRESKSMIERRTMIESSKQLVQDLNINYIYEKQNKYLDVESSFSIIENRLVQLRVATPSIKTGKELLNEITTYILNRHEDIIIDLNQSNLKFIESQVSILNNNVNNLNTEIEFHNKRLQVLIESDHEKKQAFINERIRKINQLLLTIDKKILDLKDLIIKETANLKLLETDLQLLKERLATSPSFNELIYSYKNSILDFESEKVSLENELLILQDPHSLADNQFFLNMEKELINFQTQSSYLSDKIFNLIQEKTLLENELSIWQNANTISKMTFENNSKLVGEIKTVITKPRPILFAIIGFIFGITLSIILVLIIGIKANKDEKEITL